MKKLIDQRSSPAPVILSEVGATSGARTKSTCPGVPWKDPEDLSLTMARQGILTKFLNARWSFQRENAQIKNTSSRDMRGLPLMWRNPGFVALFLIACAATPLLVGHADTKLNVQLNTENVRPRQMEDTTEKAVLRDYNAAWQAIETALASNNAAPLNDNFTGFALEKLTQRIKDQRSNELKTRIIDHGHQVEAIFYSRDGSAIELRDTASIETQVLEGSTVLHSDNAEIQYIAVLTGAADRWQVRVLESVGGNPVKESK